MAAGTKKRPPDTKCLYQGGACRWQIRRRRDGAFSDLGAGLHPIGDIGLHLVVGNIQRGGQLTEEQLLQYYRYEALPAAYARGREAKKIVSKQLQLTYMELKYVNNAFFVIEQETQAAKKFWRGNPAEARDRIRSVYEREIAQLEAKSGIRIDKQMRAVRVVELTDYAPLMPAGK